MSSVASRLTLRLLFLPLLFAVASDLVAVVFAPRLLLLEEDVVRETLPVALGIFAAAALLGVAVSAAASVRYRRALDALERSAGQGAGPAEEEREGIAPADLIGIHALPSRLATWHAVLAVALAALTLAPPLRPKANDLALQASLVVLYATIVSAGALPLYVRLRRSVSRVLELSPEVASQRAIRKLEATSRGPMRLQTRFLVAVAGPVAFVAFGASLLVYAHARAVEAEARARTATDVARGTFDVIGGTAGREAAIRAAEARGYRAGSLDDEGSASELGASVVAALEDGPMLIAFEPARVDSIPLAFIVLPLTGVLIAAILGHYIGSHFSADVSMVTHSVRATGVADVIRGTRMVRLARFISVGKLMNSIEELGDIFREFASAHAQATQAREATERMRGLFLASMSHDLKAPLNAILGFASLASRAPLSDGQRESLAIIEQRGRELLHLVQTILDAARVEAGVLTIAPESTHVGDVVMSAVLDARDLGAGGRVEVVGEVQPGIPRSTMDALRVVQALSSVILSAMRFTEEDGTVVVRATFRADVLRIDVETSARGLPEGEREKLFEAFKDADKARRHGALGLGLSLARSIVELHGGSIEVTSEEERMVFRIAFGAGVAPRRA